MPPLCASVDGAADLGPTWFSLRVRDGRGSRHKRAMQEEMRVGAGYDTGQARSGAQELRLDTCCGRTSRR
jgi:hypothetical protein